MMMSLFYLNLLMLSFFNIPQIISTYNYNLDDTLDIRKCGSVHLTVSAQKETYLELNWVTKCSYPGDIRPDYIALYDSDPRERHEIPRAKEKIWANDHPTGHYRTKIKFGHPLLPGNWEYKDNLTRTDVGPRCFPYWIASLKGDDWIIDARCLKIQPTWMNDNRDKLGSQRIGDLMIPGTHNSGSYSMMKLFLENYILNQDRDLWTQLVFGIRYFDFRIGYYENDGFYINHDLVRIQRLIPLLQQIRKFVYLAPREIIVLDFHRFPYPSTDFDFKIHENLYHIIRQELGTFILPPGGLQAGKGPTLNEIWQQNKNIIICYGQIEVARAKPFYWNPLRQYWGNKSKAKDLRVFIEQTIGSHTNFLNPMWAIMAELTPQPLDYIFRTNNLRKLADAVNKHVTVWFRDNWHNDVNIIASDYFLGNDIINVAIQINRNKTKQQG